MSLDFETVSFQYGDAGPGISGIDLRLSQGELLAVIGPSGSGKSTLLKLVSGLLEGYSGTIRLEGRDLSGVPIHKREIGMVFQNYALFPHLSVADNVGYGLKMRGFPAKHRRDKAHQLLDLVGLAAYRDVSPLRLSGGQQQRVALARALAFGPKALLLDEPLAALDASIRGHLRDEIRHLQQRFEATTLLVTHDQEEALTMADRIAVLEGGRLLQVDTPTNLYEYPNSAAVAQFVGLSSILEGTISGVNQVDVGFAFLYVQTAGRANGNKVKLLLRPEHINPRPADDDINRLVGAVVRSRYLGSTIRYDFKPQGSDIPLLGEARVIPNQAISVRPENLRLLDR